MMTETTEDIPRINPEDFHIKNAWNTYEDARVRRRRGLTTGLAGLDSTLIVLPGLLNIMGDTNCGKSTLVSNIIVHNVLQGNPVIICDNENGLTRTRTRLLCITGGIEESALGSNNFRNSEKARYDAAVETLCQAPLFYLDRIDKDLLSALIPAIGAYYKKHVLLVVDSLHAFASNANDSEELGSWVNYFNTLKNKYENRLSIIMVCEKSKAQYGMGTGGGAKGSGSIDYRAEVTLNLYPTKDRTGTVIECVKNRDGPKGVISIFSLENPVTFRLQEREYLPE